RHNACEQHSTEHLRRHRTHHEFAYLLALPAHGIGDLVSHQAIAHQLAGVNDEILAISELTRRHLSIVVLQRYDAECHMPRLVLHDVLDELFQQGLLCELIEIPKGCHGKPLNDDLHAEIFEIPATILDRGVEKFLQAVIDRPLPLELLAQVATENLNVSCLIHRLCAGVVLAVDPWHRSDELRGDNQCSLLPVK